MNEEKTKKIELDGVGNTLKKGDVWYKKGDAKE